MLHRFAEVIDQATNWLFVIFILVAAILSIIGLSSMEANHLSFFESTVQAVDAFQTLTGFRPNYIVPLIIVLKVTRYILVGKGQTAREPNDA